jgi:hypothetical protein
MKPRGHALVEVMIGGAILVWAMSGLTAGLTDAITDVGVAGDQQQASLWLQQKVEELQATPLTQWAANCGASYQTQDLGLGTHPKWLRVTSWNPPAADAYSFPTPAPGLSTSATFFSATVMISYGNPRIPLMALPSSR